MPDGGRNSLCHHPGIRFSSLALYISCLAFLVGIATPGWSSDSMTTVGLWSATFFQNTTVAYPLRTMDCTASQISKRSVPTSSLNILCSGKMATVRMVVLYIPFKTSSANSFRVVWYSGPSSILSVVSFQFVWCYYFHSGHFRQRKFVRNADLSSIGNAW